MGKKKNSAKSKQSSKKKLCSSPGPGEYKDVELNIVRQSAPEWSIKGKNSTRYSTNCLPGPGQYEIRPERTGSAYTIKGRPKTAKQECLPGPGSYKSKPA
jgi:hypothetical protein